jgi:GTP-binding protein LepA
MDLIGCKEEDMILASAKAGIGIEEILEAVVHRIPPPKGDPTKPLRALIYDSIFDSYRGVIVNIRVFDGVLKEKDKILFMATGQTYEVDEVGVLHMQRHRTGQLSARHEGRRHGDPERQPLRVGDRGLPRSEADGVLRHLSCRFR